MRSKFLLIALGSALAGCQTGPARDVPAQGAFAVNVPVVTSADYVFDAAAPSGALAPGEGERLNGWFQGLGLGYGDTIYVDGDAAAARAQVGAIELSEIVRLQGALPWQLEATRHPACAVLASVPVGLYFITLVCSTMSSASER